MNELMIVLFNVFVAVIAYAGGAAIHGLLGFGMWFIPLSLLPCFLWFWWRGPLSWTSPLKLFLFLAAGSAYIAMKDLIWPNAPDWIDQVAILAAFCLVHADAGRRNHVAEPNAEPVR
jgi:hypothetical protein